MAHDDRLAAGLNFNWPALPPIECSLKAINVNVTELRFRRERSSHRGISRLTKLRSLQAYSVDSEYLEEISNIPDLEHLYISRITTEDISPLAKLRKLKQLVIIDGFKVKTLDWTESLQSLQTLGIENFPAIQTLTDLAKLKSLRHLGIEGGMLKPMKVDSLNPLASLSNLECLFLTNLRVLDKQLQPLHELLNLRVLECANFYASGELESLHVKLPHTRCAWFDLIDQFGSIAAGRAEMAKKMT